MRHIPTLAVLLGCITALALPREARAQDADFSGTYTVATDSTNVQIPEWGPDCGQRLASHTGSTGRQVSIAYNGSQLIVTDGRRTLRSDGCWSDDTRVRRISASRSGVRWTVICATPQNEYQQVSATYTITAEETRVSMREQATYSWSLRGSNCRATATRTLTYNRVGGPPVVATADAGRPVVAARDAAAATTPPPSRCASPGAPARLDISPSRRSLAPGGRACFRARVLDANGCDAAGAPGASWQIARANGEPADATIEPNGCVRAPADARQAEYSVTATAGAFTARAVAAVVSREELQSLIAQHIEDDPSALPALQTGTASGTGVGAVVVRPPPQIPTNTGPGPAFWALVGAAVLLGLLGLVLLVRRRGANRAAVASAAGSEDDTFAQSARSGGVDPSSVSGRRRYNAVPIPVRHRAGGADAPSAAAGPAAAPPDARPLTRRCPTCDNRFTAEMAFCPEHGTALVDIASDAPSTGGVPAPIAAAPAPPAPPPAAPTAQPAAPAAQPLRCPTCGRRFEQGIVFCGEDGTPLVADG